MVCCIWTFIALFSIVGLVFIVAVCSFIKIFTSPYPKLTRSKKEEEYFNPDTGKREKFPTLDDEFSIHLSVVVPAYEEENRLPPMLEECTDYLEARCESIPEFTYEIIVVSDGSKDGTRDVALDYSKRYGSEKIRLLDLETNRGKGGAVNLGIQSSRGAVILFADADGATKFADLSKLELALDQLLKISYIEKPGLASTCDGIICGSRAHLEQEAIATRSAFRNLLMHGFHFLVWLLAVRSLKDTQCGFKLITRHAARLCFKSLHVTRWAFDVELLYIAEQLQIPLVEVSVRWTEIDGSKLIPVWSWVQMGMDLFLIWLRYGIGAWKLVHTGPR